MNEFYEKYKGTIIKLQATNFCEINGYFIDIYKNGSMLLNKPVVTADRAQFSFSSVMSDIIKLDWEDNGTLTVPLAPIYCNDSTNYSVVLNVNNYIFVPLYEPKISELSNDVINASENLSKQKNIKNIMEQYLDYVYDEYRKITSNINITNNDINIDENNNKG